MNSITILSIFAVSLGLVFGGDLGACDSFTNCRCQFSDGSVLDLSEVGTLHFTDVNGEWSYQYDPCTSLKLEGKCANAVACKYNLLTKVYDSLGLESEATFSNDQGKVSISYTEGAQTFQVNLECTSGDDKLTQTKADDSNYVFSLSGSHVCVQAASTSTTPSSTTTPASTTTTPKATNTTATTPTSSTTTPTANTTKTTPTSGTTSKTTKTTPTSGTTSKTTKTTATTGTTSKTTGTTTGTTKNSTSGKPTTKTTPATATSKKPTGSTKPTVSPGTTMTTKHGAASAISSLTFGSLVVLAFLSRKLL